MTSTITPAFRKLRDALPPRIREQAEKQYGIFRRNPAHPSVQFKRIHAQLPIYSVRIDLNYRAVGVLRNNKITWFWIGPHDEYERLIKSF